MFPANHAIHSSEFWALVPEVVHPQHRRWIEQALPRIFADKHCVALINLEFVGVRNYYFAVAGLEFELDQDSKSWKEFCKQLERKITFPTEITGKRERWNIQVKDGSLGKVKYEQVPRLFIGDQCTVLDCEEKITHRGRLAAEQWTEEQELEEARGKWTSARISAYRYYCTKHTKCAVDHHCKGPLSMITTTLCDAQSGSQLHGDLFCARHAPPGPTHLLMDKF